jgi:hypothetical protein
MGTKEYEAIKAREKSGKKVVCPVCGTYVLPKCPFYAVCIYRIQDLGDPAFCMSHPESCIFFKHQGGVSKMDIKVNPSRRDDLDYEPV